LLGRATTAYVTATGREPEPDGLAAALALVTCVDCDELLSARPGGLRECVNPECDMSIVRKAAALTPKQSQSGDFR
jgi:hypothetical protein